MDMEKKIKHILVDAGMEPGDIQRQLKERFRVKISPQYVSLILRGQRTGYRYRPMIAKILNKSERELFGPRKSRKRKFQNGGDAPAAA